MHDVARRLGATASATEARGVLTEVAGLLLRAPENAAGAITRFLESKADAATHLRFALAADGSLEEAPTLRTFLLDYLAKTDPSAAAAYAQNILADKDSADEWAVALRACALAGRGESFLKEKLREMIAHEAWRQNPSAGFLEAFDVVVHTRDIELTTQLAELIRNKDNQAVAHAAYLALDRLVQLEPHAVLDQLLSKPELLSGREATRANFFARANAGDAAQRAILESYLLSSSAAELETFTGLFPNANFMISANLLTRAYTPDSAALAQRDAEALRVVRAWLTDARFVGRRAQLEAIRQRLERFVQQAGVAAR